MNVQEALLSGEPACFPTETLWALAARPESAAKLFALKKRPEGFPLAVGFRSWKDALEFVVETPVARALSTLLPGPISLVVPMKDARLAMAAPGLRTLSIRIPSHPLAQRLLANGPLLMTSANAHGQPDPILASEITFDVPIVGDCVPGMASTIVDCTGAEPRILRAGVIAENVVFQTFSEHS